MVYVFLAEGFEEIEALTPVDILRRGGIEVKTVGVGSKTIVGAHGISVVCDLCDTEALQNENLEGIVLPGGMPGTINLEKSSIVNDFIDYANKNNLLVSAICAAPSILGHKGILKGKKATCYPSFEKDLIGADFLAEPVVCDGNIITARAAGVACDFAFSLLEYFAGKDKAESQKASILWVK